MVHDAVVAPQRQGGSEGGLKFRFKLSILGIVFALMLAIGVMMMMQQAAVVYPTIKVVVLTLVLGLAVGIILPSLARTFARKRKK